MATEPESKAAVIPHVGMADVCAAELASLFSCDSQTQPGVVYFNVPLLELCELCDRLRSALRVLLVLGTKQGNDLTLVAHNLANDVDVSEWLLPNVTFACRSTVPDVSMEIEADVGGILKDRYGSRVNLNNPQVRVVVHATGDTVLLGIDISGDSVAKREYRIFLVLTPYAAH